MPLEDCLRFHDRGDILQGLQAQPLAELGQPDPLGVRERHPARELRSEDLVLRGKVLVAEQDLFLDVTSDERERFDGFHGHRSSETRGAPRRTPTGEPPESAR